MKNRSVECLALLCAILALCVPLRAHHGSAAYQTKVMEMKSATVTKFTWSNPHALIYFDVKDDKGSVAHWVGEIGSPTNVSVLGWTRNSLHPGDVVTVYVWPAKSGRTVGRMNRVVLPDGRTLRDSQLGGGEGEGGDK
jgi:hypothetical protein